MVSVNRLLRALKGHGLASEAKLERVPKDGMYPAWSRVVVKSDLMSVSSKTFGRDSFLFIKFEDTAARNELCRLLYRLKVGWCEWGDIGISIQVRGFKGWHWWEQRYELR